MRLFLKKKTLLIILCITLPLVYGITGAKAEPVNMGPYFPLETGRWWNFSEDGSLRSVKILAGTVDVKGVSTKVMLWSDGVKQCYTNDANGIREHKDEYDNFYQEWVPTIGLARATMSVGDTVETSGKVYQTFTGLPLDGMTLSYSHFSMFYSYETATVPFGSFETIRLEMILTTGEPPYEATKYYTIWLAKNIGMVKYHDSDTGKTGVLIDTKVIPKTLPALVLLLNH